MCLNSLVILSCSICTVLFLSCYLCVVFVYGMVYCTNVPLVVWSKDCNVCHLVSHSVWVRYFHDYWSDCCGVCCRYSWYCRYLPRTNPQPKSSLVQIMLSIIGRGSCSCQCCCSLSVRVCLSPPHFGSGEFESGLTYSTRHSSHIQPHSYEVCFQVCLLQDCFRSSPYHPQRMTPHDSLVSNTWPRTG